MQNRICLIVLYTFLCEFSFFGCSTVKPKTLHQEKSIETRSSESGVEIHYALGKDHYLLQILASGNSINAKSFLNKKIIEQGDIDPKRYQDFLKKASQFVSIPALPVATIAPCRSPFSVTVRLNQLSKTAAGCRSRDNGALSRLVRDGEFLLYSKN